MTVATALVRRPFWVGPLIVLLMWQFAANAIAETFVLAAPTAILGYLFDNAGLMARALVETLSNALAGFVIGNLAAVILAAIATVWPRSDAMVRGMALVVFCLPLVATGPIWPPASMPSITSASAPERNCFFASASVGAKTITLAPISLSASRLPLGGNPPASTTWLTL